MSTFVLNRDYELQLPMSYSEVDGVEMEYVNGGAPSAEEVAWSVIISVGSCAIYDVLKKYVTWSAVKALAACLWGPPLLWIGGIAIGSAILYVGFDWLYKNHRSVLYGATADVNAHRYCCQGMAIGKH